MKTTFIFLMIVALIPQLIHAEMEQIDTNSPQDCDFKVYSPVVGKDKHYYLNKCWAEKKGVKILKGGYKKKYFKQEDVYTWIIEDVCIPSSKEQPVLKDLEDGTFLYTYTDRTFRGTPNRCRCLPASTLIACPSGPIAIDQLKEGDLVLTINPKGETVQAPLKWINKVSINDKHSMLIVDLADGRSLQVTPEHPSSFENKTINQFEVGDKLDGSIIVKKEMKVYNEAYTYDILPEGETGYYWANGILIGSTLSKINALLTEDVNQH